MFFFPATLVVIYVILFVMLPDKASLALRNSSRVFLNILVPLCLVFILMLILNLFLKPGHIVRFVGKEAGIKGTLLSIIAGIISMGPIYAWYPLLKDLREKGAATSLIAIFLGNRAIKPFLLPLMISYFGWAYVLILTILTCFGSFAAGYIVSAFVKD